MFLAMENNNLEPKRNRLENMDQILLFGNMIMLKAPYFSKLQNEHFLISSGLSMIKKDISPG